MLPKSLLLSIPSIHPNTLDDLHEYASHADQQLYKSIVATDPAFCARLLESAPACASIDDLFVRVGWEESLVLATAWASAEPYRQSPIKQQSMARHNLFVANFAELSVEHYGASMSSLSPEQAFTLGALHDLGSIAFAASDPESFRTICDFAKESGTPFDMAFNAVYPRTTQQIGGLILAAFNAFEPYCESLANYDMGFNGEWPEIRCVLQIADHLATVYGYGWESWPLESEIPTFVNDAFRENEGLFAALAERATARTNEYFCPERDDLLEA